MSGEPPTVAGDGRNLDPELAGLSGEAIEQQPPADRAGSEGAAPFDVWTSVPGSGPERGGSGQQTYYDRPVLKEPTWIWAVPAYFYVGGAAGATAALGAAAQLANRKRLPRLIKRCRWIAAAGGGVGAALLVMDLGRPSRFLNMLRTFRPSSPMNLGSWVLATIAPLAVGAAVLEKADGLLGLAGDVAELNSGLAGLPLSGYTAVLLANTAVPVWQGTRRSLPPLFVGSAMSSGASLLQLLPMDEAEARTVNLFAAAGAATELAAGTAMEREAAAVPEVARALHEGLPGALLRASKALTGAALGLTVLAGRRRWGRRAAGLCGTASSLALKFGVFEAGKASARDPRATFAQQHAGRGAAEVTGRPAVAAP